VIITTAELLANLENYVDIRESSFNQCKNEKMDFLIKFTKELKSGFENHHLKIKQIAKQIALSERQLYRNSKLYLTLTPSTFLRRYRLEKSIKKIKQGNSLGNISYEVGFSSHSYFCRCFKENFGDTPSDFIDCLNQNAIDNS
jgi:AraC-like DNA-binding protein